MLERFTWFRQSAFRYDGDGLTLYIDPWQSEGPPADVVLVTHAHFDHFQPEEIERLRRSGTKLVAPADVARELPGDVTAVAPGDSFEVAGVRGQAVSAYNVVEERLEAHPRGNNWVGYVLELAGITYYHAGDTDRLEELERLRVDVAFVPIGGTFTMDHGEAAGLVRAMQPGLAVPMHYGYVVGEPAVAEQFRQEADPVKVEVLTPVRPFEL